MDPTAALVAFLQDLRDLEDDPDNDDAREEAATKMDDLAQWLRDGGAPPDMTVVGSGYTESA